MKRSKDVLEEDEDIFLDIPESELLARELEYWLKCNNLPPKSYLRDLIRRSAETIHSLCPDSLGVSS